MSKKSSAPAGGPQPEQPPLVQTENLDGVIVELDGLGDTTIRPARSPVLRQIRPDQPPPPDKK